MADIFANLTRADKLEAIRLLEERERRIRETQIARYKPYPKQQEFHAAGLNHRERLFRAGNQLGKSYSGGAEAAYHLTGLYPDWWQGRRFTQPTSGWVGAPSGEIVRDGAQKVLLGRADDWGTGMKPSPALDR